MTKFLNTLLNNKPKEDKIKEAIISLLLNENTTAETLYIFESVRLEIEDIISNRQIHAQHEINAIAGYFKKDSIISKMSVTEAEYMDKPLCN